VFACSRIASKRIANPKTYAEVPCLSRIEEAAIIGAVSRGAHDVLLVDGNCSSCKFGACSSIADETISYTRSLLSTHGPRVEIKRTTGFPEELHSSTPIESAGTSRRAFFSEAVGAARDTAMAAAKTTVENELGIAGNEASIGERLRVTESGSLPRISVQRHDDILNALDELGVQEGAEIKSRLFASVTIDEQRCNSCGMCAVFCPTGALVRDKPKELGDPLKYLEFSACDCVQCDLCKDVCWKSALTLTYAVPAGELYDFEPTVFRPGSRK
jgi:ferredoxin